MRMRRVTYQIARVFMTNLQTPTDKPADQPTKGYFFEDDDGSIGLVPPAKQTNADQPAERLDAHERWEKHMAETGYPQDQPAAAEAVTWRWGWSSEVGHYRAFIVNNGCIVREDSKDGIVAVTPTYLNALERDRASLATEKERIEELNDRFIGVSDALSDSLERLKAARKLLDEAASWFELGARQTQMKRVVGFKAGAEWLAAADSLRKEQGRT